MSTNSFNRYPALRFFEGLGEEEQNQLKVIHFKQKEYLIREEEIGAPHLYYILEGVCISDIILPKDDHLFVGFKILPQEFVGLLETISPQPLKRRASIMAKTPVTALTVSRSQLLRWQVHYPQLYNQIICHVLTVQFRSRSLNINCASLDLRHAGAYYLHYLYETYLKGCYPKGYQGPVKIWDTQQEIAEVLSRDKRSISRLIGSLRSSGHITLYKGKVHIDNQQAEAMLRLLTD